MNKIKQLFRKTKIADYLRLISNQFSFYTLFKKTDKGFYFKGLKKMRKGAFEPEVCLFLEEQFKFRNNLFIDVGAHQGYFSCLANSRDVKQVISIEPDVYNFKYLRSNLKKNKYLNKSHLFNIGLANTMGYLEFFGFGTGISVNKNWSGNVSKRKFKVDVNTFDDLLSGFLPLYDSVIKIDVEGYELEVLRGAKLALNTSQNVAVVIEINDRLESIRGRETFLDIIEIFYEYKFKMFEFKGNDGKFQEVSYENLSQVTSDLRRYKSINYIFLK